MRKLLLLLAAWHAAKGLFMLAGPNAWYGFVPGAAPVARRLPQVGRAGAGGQAIRTSNRRFQPSEEDVGRFGASFQEALLTDDLDNLKKLLANDVELVTDGGR